MTTLRGIQDSFPIRRLGVIPYAPTIILCLLGCSHSLSSQGTRQAQEPKAPPAPVLILAPLAGQPIPFLPATYLIAADSVAGLPRDHAAQLLWADSLMLSQLLIRGPEVSWVPPAELRKFAARAPGTVLEPEKMGQSMLRSTSIKTVPDQLMVKLRPMIGMANARYVMVPAALTFTQTASGVEVNTTFVLVDARTAAIMWRSEPQGKGATAAAALSAIFPKILP